MDVNTGVGSGFGVFGLQPSALPRLAPAEMAFTWYLLCIYCAQDANQNKSGSYDASL